MAYIDELLSQVSTHPPTKDCPDPECLVCGIRDCPHGEPLHYHHDGCPACYVDNRPESERPQYDTLSDDL